MKIDESKTICANCKYAIREDYYGYWTCHKNPQENFVLGEIEFWFCKVKNDGNCKDYEKQQEVNI